MRWVLQRASHQLVGPIPIPAVDEAGCRSALIGKENRIANTRIGVRKRGHRVRVNGNRLLNRVLTTVAIGYNQRYQMAAIRVVQMTRVLQVAGGRGIGKRWL